MKKLALIFALVVSFVGCSAAQKQVEQAVVSDATAACAAAIALGATDATVLQICGTEGALAPFVGQVIAARNLPPEEKAMKMRSFQKSDAGK